MREELEAIKVTLMTTLPVNDYRSSDVFIARAETDLPAGTRLPAFGIKDGAETVEKQSCDLKRRTFTVSVICWAPTEGRSEEQVVGEAGVLKMAEDVEHILDGNFLGLEGIQLAEIRDTRESLAIVFEDSGKEAHQKVLVFQYEREHYHATE